MTQVSIRELRSNLKRLIDEVAAGGEVSILRRGEEVARLVPPKPPKRVPFPDLTKFRNSIKVKGEPLSQTVIQMRREERF